MKTIVLLFLLFQQAYSQTDYPKNYFQSPLPIPLQLSGNFGELRPNHFHAGFDFKTQKKEGFDVLAAADGFISRIKITENGYGKAIYITHPNGYTTVYGHLQKGIGKWEQLIKELQYQSQSYAIDIQLPPNLHQVKKGEVLALTGNSGSSEGPHLHFEIRDTTTEKIINPFHFGFDQWIPDAKRPVLHGLLAYPLGENSVVNTSKIPIAISVDMQPDGSYLAEKVEVHGTVGFGIQVSDTDDVSWNANGIYQLETFLNGQSTFSYQFDSFAFDETRYVNALIDYERYLTQKIRYHTLFLHQAIPLSILRTTASLGKITSSNNLAQTYRIELRDFFQNTTRITIPISFTNSQTTLLPSKPVSPYLCKFNRESIFEKENVTVVFPEQSFYADVALDFKVANGTAQVHENTIPLHKSFYITFSDSTMSEETRNKTIITWMDGKKRVALATKRYKNSFSAASKTLGSFSLAQDFVPPKIVPRKGLFKKWLSASKRLEFTIADALSGIERYEGYLNGKWILLEYDPKQKLLFHDMEDGLLQEGNNHLKITVTDNVGNSTIFETHFFRSQKP